MRDHTRSTRIVLVGNEGTGDAIQILVKGAKDFPHMLYHAQTAAELLSLRSEAAFDVVLWDLSASDKELESLKNICDGFPTVPVIAIINDDSEKMRQQALRVGAYAALIKDAIDRAGLESTIRSVIGHKRNELEEEQQRILEQAAMLLRQQRRVSHRSISPETLGMRPLSEVMPYKFLELTKSYSNLLDIALTRATSGIRFNGYSVTRRLQFLASDLGALRAGARDVFDIHAKAVESNRQALTEPGDATHRILLELISDLVSYYRRSGRVGM
jgi:DNA-binding NarL/FixJ family response regulator